MSIELIGGIVALVLALVGGGVGWSQIRKHGRELEKRKRAEGERDAAIEEAEIAARPPLSGAQSVDALRGLRASWWRRKR